MKKIICIVLSFVLVSSMTIFSYAQAESKSPAHDSIDEVIENGSIVSVTDFEIEIVYETEICNDKPSLYSNTDSSLVQKKVSSCKIVTDSTENTQNIYNELSLDTDKSSGTQSKEYTGALAILYSTIYYSATEINSVKYIWITSASGSVTLFDYPTSIIGSTATFGQVGFTVSDGFKEQVYEKDLGKVFSWTAYPPSSFQKVAMVEMNSLTWVGCAYNCTVRRGTADSTYTLANNAFSM